MNSSNYVAPLGNGWVVVINGQNRGTYSSQNQAENAYNAMGGPGAGGNAPPPSGPPASPPPSDTGGGAAPYGQTSSQILADAMASTNREQFDEKIRQFNETLAWEKQRYGMDKQTQDRQLWAGLASNLNQTAASLHGQPRDWQKYAQYTQGGQDIFKTLWGNQPVAQFGAPTGNSAPITLADILKDLGVTTAPGGTTPGTSGPPATSGQDAALDAIWAHRPDFAAAAPNAATPEQRRAFVLNWLKTSQEAPVLTANRDPVAYAGNWKTTATGGSYMPSPGPETGGSYPGDVGAKTTPGPGPEWPPGTTNPLPATTGTGGVTGPTGAVQAPLPFQMNPLVWDSLSDTAKQMVLGSVEAGNTPSGVWTATDWMNQFNASRPKGQAPRSVNYNYGAPRSYF